MSDFNSNKSGKLQWICASSARRLVGPYITDPGIDVWTLDLFTIYRLLVDLYPDTLFFLVDDFVDERLEVL